MRRRSTIGWWVAALALVALGLGAYVLFLRRQPPLTSPAQETVPPAQVPGAPEAPASPEPPPTPGASEPEGVPTTTLPPLAQSDAPVRELARGLSPNPALSRWLSGEGLIPRFVAVVDNVAEGVSPRPHLLFLAPEASFQTVTRNGRLYVDPRSYGRYDGVARRAGRRTAQVNGALRARADDRSGSPRPVGMSLRAEVGVRVELPEHALGHEAEQPDARDAYVDLPLERAAVERDRRRLAP